MKKCYAKTWVVAVCFFCLFDVVKANSQDPTVYVNGNKTQTQVKTIDNVVYVPLLSLGNSLGFEVQSQTNTNTIEISTKSTNSDVVVPNIIQTVSPCVVGIIGNYESGNSSSQDKYMQSTAHGTGVIIKSNGEILTNAHVVKNLKNIVVILNDGSAYNGKVKNIDEKTDLAVVKIDKAGLPVVRFASMETVVAGKSVIAIGTPISFSLMNSASMGIVSGLNRGLASDYALIQTDAAINPGNSGGPLVNMAGEVIGINSSKFAAVGIEGMGFAIPADTVSYVLSHFDTYGIVVRPELGMVFEESWAARMGLPTKEGLFIASVSGGSIASKAGIQKGDTLVSINNTRVSSEVDVNECLKAYWEGDVVTLSIWRGGKFEDIAVTL